MDTLVTAKLSVNSNATGDTSGALYIHFSWKLLMMLVCYHLRARPGVMAEGCILIRCGAPWQMLGMVQTFPSNDSWDNCRLAGHLLILLQEGWMLLGLG